MTTTASHVALSEIRRQLWSGHASVMVGSGFSRNADRASSTIPYPPDWNELGRGFVDRLYPSADEREKNSVLGSKSVLQLAQEYEAAFQRPALNRFVKELICDENLIPNTLFSRLLELPWNDVFTTNYDTLLERAARNVLSQKYDVVYSCRDLAFSDVPRIIKLHGSFPSDATPLIVTEEDYRTYPTKYSPFVNTVQQTLMENVLCLIGFSGSDPNFLKWIGWVRDNLGESMPSIYLMGFMHLTDAERRVLESKRIIPVDLSEFVEDAQGRYSDALDRVFAFLEERPDFIEWTPIDIGDLTKLSADEAVELIKDLERNRLAYPNWIVAPWSKQSRMFHSTDEAVNSLARIEALPSPWDIKGLYEINWRLERCLTPIKNHAIENYQRILAKYRPFDREAQPSEWLRNAWRELVFAVYRWSREESQTLVRRQLEPILEEASADDVELMNRLCFEKVMWAFSLPDVKLLSAALSKWDAISRPPLWNIRFAAFLCETGEVEKATQIYDTVLASIRPNIPKGKIKSDYFLLGLEGIILTALNNAHAAVQSKKCNEIKVGFGLEYHHRLEELANIGCDPNVHMSRFHLLMTAPESREIGEVTSREFDMITRSWRMTYGWPKDCKNAYQFARFVEEISIPLYTDNFTNDITSAAPGCVRRLVEYSSGWAFALYNRIGRSERATEETFMSQRKESLLKRDMVDSTIIRYCDQIHYLMEKCPEQLLLTSTSVHRRVATVMFEILSRLTAKASQESLERLLELGMKIEKIAIDGYDITFRDIHSVFYRRAIRAMQPDVLFKHLEDLLSISLPPKQPYRRWWHSPISFVEWRGLRRSRSDCSESVGRHIESLVRSIKSDDRLERTAALLALNTCIELGICTEQEKLSVAQNLLVHVNPNGLPDIGRFYKHAFLGYLAPAVPRSEIEKIVKRSYVKFNFESLTEEDVKNNRCNSGSRIEWFAGSVLATSSFVHVLPQNAIRLSPREGVALWGAFKRGFEVSKIRANSAPKVEWTMSSGLRERFSNDSFYYDRILSEVIIPCVSGKIRIDIAEWLSEEHIGSSFLCSRLMLERKNKTISDELGIDILTALTDSDSRTVTSGFRAVYDWCELFAAGKFSASPCSVLHDLTRVIGMRDGRAFFEACETLSKIVDHLELSGDDERYVWAQLGRLVCDTEYDSQSNRFENETRGDYRAASANLANKMYKSYITNGREIPESIKRWKAICLSPEELDSVRRMWTEVESVSV